MFGILEKMDRFSNKLMTTDSPTTPNLLPFNKLKSVASGVDFKSLFSDVINKVNPQSDTPQNNDTFGIEGKSSIFVRGFSFCCLT